MDYIIAFLVSLATGCLLGDAFIHILPHTLVSSSEEDEHEHEEEEDHDDDHLEEDHIDIGYEDTDDHHDEGHFDTNLYALFILIGMILLYLVEKICSHYVEKY